MRRNTIPCTIRYIIRCIIVRFTITRCIIPCITRYIIKIKNPKQSLRVFFFMSQPDYALAVVGFVFCAGVAAGASPPRGLPLAKSTRKGAATKIEE